MTSAFLEHVNITVTDPEAAAQTLCRMFDWHIRWRGDSIYEGLSVHVGSDSSYLALYSKGDPREQEASTYDIQGGLNHLAIVVDDLDETEARIRKAGFDTHSHADYEPGKRFYFHFNDGIEFEVVSY
ncbi:MAG: glyoxalase [Hyphomicrobiales bacterium]|nr:MAG: glyoxalase [Hyphomicrobiales bacterium]